ncbi:DUF2092 domain-containing protein [Pseudomonas cavernae]|uniref:DUF2092 domain-containing protein n=1 Tax=Pseudomonas cavernae TaxID=2320867 RepID=A0A385Z2C4_9PSED|nr:DUF2092 domain-containing protein [Pseudomonas cavernae]AYC33236.1 DUF2092 domain-containing protein [Pseudomonas cavernae]
MQKCPPLAAALLLAALSGPALAADPPAPAITYERDAKALSALQKMGGYLRSLERFEISATSTTDQVLGTGQTVQLAHRTELKVQRPNKLQVTVDDGQYLRSLYYDGSHFVLYGTRHNYYSRLEAPKDIDALLDQLEGRYGIQLPLADLFYWGSGKSSPDSLQSALYLGTEKLGSKSCEHYAYRQEGVDWQLWLENGKQPLPCQLQLTNRNDEARPQHGIRLNWKLNPDFTASTFQFKTPEGALSVELRQLEPAQPARAEE